MPQHISLYHKKKDIATYPGWRRYDEGDYYIFSADEAPNTLYVDFSDCTASYFPSYRTDREEESVGKILGYKPVSFIRDSEVQPDVKEFFHSKKYPQVIWWFPPDFFMTWERI